MTNVCISKDIVKKQKKRCRNWTSVFHFICSAAAFSLTCWCVYKYVKDEDVSHVNYRRYHSEKDNIYPSLTLCFNNPFLNHKLVKYGDGINTTTYVKFLKGLHWDERMIDIHYDNVTLNIDGVLYLRIKDPYKASYGVEDPEFAITQLAQTTMRSEIGKITLDTLFRERDNLNAAIVIAINQASEAWGIQCMRYEIRDIRMPSRVQEAM